MEMTDRDRGREREREVGAWQSAWSDSVAMIKKENIADVFEHFVHASKLKVLTKMPGFQNHSSPLQNLHEIG